MLVEFRVQKYGCLRNEQVPSVVPLREDGSAAEAISLFSRSRERLWQKLAHALATPDLPEGKACTLEQNMSATLVEVAPHVKTLAGFFAHQRLVK